MDAERDRSDCPVGSLAGPDVRRSSRFSTVPGRLPNRHVHSGQSVTGQCRTSPVCPALQSRHLARIAFMGVTGFIPAPLACGGGGPAPESPPDPPPTDGAMRRSLRPVRGQCQRVRRRILLWISRGLLRIPLRPFRNLLYSPKNPQVFASRRGYLFHLFPGKTA